MVLPGKPHLEIRELKETDFANLEVFCDQCLKLGWHNNSSLEKLKVEKLIMPYGKFFIGYDHNNECIWNIAGIHQLPEISPTAWRCLFRGAQLPGYSVSSSFSKNIFKNGFHLSYFLPIQINYIKSLFEDAQFYMTSNSPSNQTDTAGKSIRMDKIMRNTLLKSGVITEYASEFDLYYTKQSIWKINQKRYWEERSKVLFDLCDLNILEL